MQAGKSCDSDLIWGVGSLGIPCYTTLAMRRIWDLAKACPQQALEWLSLQATRNRYVQTVLLTTLDSWVEPYLMAHPNVKVRTSAAFLVVSLVPSVHFRQAFRQSVAARGIGMKGPGGGSDMGGNNQSSPEPSQSQQEQVDTLHRLLEFLFGLLPNAKQYINLQQHGSHKLVAYFQTMTHFLCTKNEKLIFCGKGGRRGTVEGSTVHFDNLWFLLCSVVTPGCPLV